MSLAIEVGIGLAFVFALVALMCTGLQEMLAAALNLRGKTLWEGVQSMLQANAPANTNAAAREDVSPSGRIEAATLKGAAKSGANQETLAPPRSKESSKPLNQGIGMRSEARSRALIGDASESETNQQSSGTLLEAALRVHPLITALVPDRFGPLGLMQWIRGTRAPSADIGNAKPSYLQASTFATVLVDKIGETWEGGSRRFDDFGQAVAAMPESPLKKILQGMVRDTQGDPAKLRAAIEAWYDETMVRVGGWYKRRTQVMLLLMGFLAAGAMNIDAIHIAGALASQPSLRTALADRAADAAAAAKQDKPSTEKSNQATAALNDLRDLNLPIGWSGGRPVIGLWDGALMVLGWLITALAASFGAPFWFDLINKLVPLRSSGAKPASAPEPPAAAASTAPGARPSVGVGSGPVAGRPEPFRAALNDFEAALSAADVLQVKRTLGVDDAGSGNPTLDQNTREAIQRKQAEMGWPASGQLSAHWVSVLRTGGV